MNGDIYCCERDGRRGDSRSYATSDLNRRWGQPAYAPRGTPAGQRSPGPAHTLCYHTRARCLVKPSSNTPVLQRTRRAHKERGWYAPHNISLASCPSGRRCRMLAELSTNLQAKRLKHQELNQRLTRSYKNPNIDWSDSYILPYIHTVCMNSVCTDLFIHYQPLVIIDHSTRRQGRSKEHSPRGSPL